MAINIFTILSNPFFILASLLFVFIVVPLIIKFKFPNLWLVMWSFLPWRRKIIKNMLEKEKESAKRYKYDSFEDFLRDAPKYTIDDSFIGKTIRNLKRASGARFQQYVFIDKQDPQDKTTWFSAEKGIVYHEGGTYFKPWKSEKEIIYFDIVDSRPLIDLTEEMNWQNPDMAADNVTALTNAKVMSDMGNEPSISKYTIIILVLVGITILLLVGVLYTQDKSQKDSMAMLIQIANNTKNGVITIR